MPRTQTPESESLEEKIKRIRRKNEEIEKRRMEVEADKQTAAKLNALVTFTVSEEHWPMPRSLSPEEDRERKPRYFESKNKGRLQGKTFNDGNKPPPDPVNRFLADSERDPSPTNDRVYHVRDRTQGAARNRNRGHKGYGNVPIREQGNRVYDAWRAERNRIDEERINRQRTAQGQWRREWDNQKSEEDWVASNKKPGEFRDSNSSTDASAAANRTAPRKPVVGGGRSEKPSTQSLPKTSRNDTARDGAPPVRNRAAPAPEPSAGRPAPLVARRAPRKAQGGAGRRGGGGSRRASDAAAAAPAPAPLHTSGAEPSVFHPAVSDNTATDRMTVAASSTLAQNTGKRNADATPTHVGDHNAAVSENESAVSLYAPIDIDVSGDAASDTYPSSPANDECAIDDAYSDSFNVNANETGEHAVPRDRDTDVVLDADVTRVEDVCHAQLQPSSDPSAGEDEDPAPVLSETAFDFSPCSILPEADHTAELVAGDAPNASATFVVDSNADATEATVPTSTIGALTTEASNSKTSVDATTTGEPFDANTTTKAPGTPNTALTAKTAFDAPNTGPPANVTTEIPVEVFGNAALVDAPTTGSQVEAPPTQAPIDVSTTEILVEDLTAAAHVDASTTGTPANTSTIEMPDDVPTTAASDEALTTMANSDASTTGIPVEISTTETTNEVLTTVANADAPTTGTPADTSKTEIPNDVLTTVAPAEASTTEALTTVANSDASTTGIPVEISTTETTNEVLTTVANADAPTTGTPADTSKTEIPNDVLTTVAPAEASTAEALTTVANVDASTIGTPVVAPTTEPPTIEALIDAPSSETILTSVGASAIETHDL